MKLGLTLDYKGVVELMTFVILRQLRISIRLLSILIFGWPCIIV